MENYSYHLPFFVVTGGIATSGHSSDLTSGKVGLYDRSTFSVATNTGNGTEFYFAQGTIGGKDWYQQQVVESHKSPFFFGRDVEDMYLSLPQRLQNEEWIIGYNGAASSKTLKFVKDEALRIKFYFHGEPTYRFFNGPKEYVVSYTPKIDCTTPCDAGDCDDAITDCLGETQKLIDLINAHTELHKFGVQAKLVTADYSAAATNMTKYCITLCDNGDALSLAAVVAQAPVGVSISRTVRAGASSTYQFCQADGADAPATFKQLGSVLLAVCTTCPANAFLIPAKDVYTVRRPIVGGEDFSTAKKRDDYANTVWSTYATAASITTTSSTTSTSTNSGFLANPDAIFVGQAGSIVIVTLKFLAGSALTVQGADTLEFNRTEDAQCQFDQAAPIAWATCGTGISSSRTMKIKALNRPDCNTSGDRIADVKSVLAGVKGIDLNSVTKIAGTACADDYTVNQVSIDCLDEGCLTSNVTFTYDDLPAYENKQWELVPAVISPDATRKCGIRVTAGYIDPKFGNCSFNPLDYYETQPVKMELSLLQEDGDRCDVAAWPSVQQAKIGRISRQSGEYILREVIMKTDAYQKHVKQFDLEPRMREAFDMNLLGTVDRNAFYNLYYVRYKASYAYSSRKNEQEKFTTVFAFKEGDPSAKTFEENVLNVLTKRSGKVLHINK